MTVHWTIKTTSIAEERRERAKHRLLKKESLHLSYVSINCSSFNETVPQTFIEIEVSTDSITMTKTMS